MATVRWALLCDNVQIDQGGSGKISLLGLYNQVSAAALPLTAPLIVVASEMRGTPGQKADATLSVTDPAGQQILTVTSAVEISAQGGGYWIHGLQNTTFPVAGTYVFTLTCEQSSYRFEFAVFQAMASRSGAAH